MGDLFNKFKKSLDKGVNKVSIKSNTMVEINRVKGIINTLKGNIQSKKIGLADCFYRMYLDRAIDIEQCTVFCEEIKALEAEIKIKKREIEEIKSKEEILLEAAKKPKAPSPIITPQARREPEVIVPSEVTEVNESIEEKVEESEEKQ